MKRRTLLIIYVAAVAAALTLGIGSQKVHESVKTYVADQQKEQKRLHHEEQEKLKELNRLRAEQARLRKEADLLAKKNREALRKRFEEIRQRSHERRMRQMDEVEIILDMIK